MPEKPIQFQTGDIISYKSNSCGKGPHIVLSAEDSGVHFQCQGAKSPQWHPAFNCTLVSRRIEDPEE